MPQDSLIPIALRYYTLLLKLAEYFNDRHMDPYIIDQIDSHVRYINN